MEGAAGSAKTPLRKALEIDPRSADAHAALALVFQTEMENDLADKHYREALSARKDARILNNYGSFLFEQINPDLWRDITISMLTLFRIATFEDWTDVMYETMAVHPWSWVYYLSFIFLTAFVFLNMMIGVVLDVMQSEHEKFNREEGLGEAGEVHWIKEHTAEMEQRLMRMEQMLLDLKKEDVKG